MAQVSSFPTPNPSPVDALIPRMNENNEDNENALTVVEQTLGGELYRIDSSKVAEKIKSPLWKRAFKTSAMILASPVLFPTAFLYTLSMYVGPTWYRHKITKLLITSVMKEVAELFGDDRKELLKSIRPDDLILDLGAGSGYYLQLLTNAGARSKDMRVVALEPVSNFHDNYRRLAEDAGLQREQVEVYASDIESFVQDHPLRRATFDWVILGNVMCEVDDQHSTLRCINALLKPGGHVYFSEHIGSPRGTWQRKFQDWFNPIWNTAGAGCNCNRDSLENLRSMPDWQVISWNCKGFNVAMGAFVLGLAIKNDVNRS